MMSAEKLSPQVIAKIEERLAKLQLINCFDGRKPESRPTPSQQEVLDDILAHKYRAYWCLGGNQSGKSQLLRRVIAWFLSESQPDIPFKRKPEWQGPLQGLLVSRSHKQLSESLVPGILAFFSPGELKVVHTSNYIDKIIHVKTGNYIICAVHDQPAQAREKLQSFTVPAVFLDELPAGPAAYKLIEELEARCMVMKGFLFAAFTPKSLNKMVKDHVESAAPPVAKKYNLRFIDNPAADAETIQARLQQISHMPEHMQKTVLEGSWMQAESTVYHLTDYAIQPPPDYSPLWRHVVGVDPGLESFQATVAVAENPATGLWYTIYAEKHGKLADVDDAVQKVADYITKSSINVCKIVYDAAGTYWYLHAKKHPILSRYKIEKPWNKNSTSRREDMISAVQTAIGATLFVAPWLEDLIEEFHNYSWSETTPGKIVKAQKYHCLDALRYTVDCLPKWDGPKAVQEDLTWTEQVHREIRQYNLEARERAAQRRAENNKPGSWRKQQTTRTWRGGRIKCS